MCIKYLDCATTPTTSAYRSATMCMLPVLGPKYLRHQHKVMILQYRHILKIICSHNCGWICKKISCLHSYPSLYLKCLKAKFITSWISPSKRGWRGIWIKRECCNLSAHKHANNLIYFGSVHSRREQYKVHIKYAFSPIIPDQICLRKNTT